jgi:hypothetical protein
MQNPIVPTVYTTAAEAWDAAARYRRMAHTAWEAGWVPQAEAYDRQAHAARDAWKELSSPPAVYDGPVVRLVSRWMA